MVITVSGRVRSAPGRIGVGPADIVDVVQIGRTRVSCHQWDHNRIDARKFQSESSFIICDSLRTHRYEQPNRIPRNVFGCTHYFLSSAQVRDCAIELSDYQQVAGELTGGIHASRP